MLFHLITGFGRSTQEFNNNDNNITGQGVLQGSSSAAPIYIINSDIFLSAYKKLGKGSTFYHPLTKNPKEDKTVQYVDDTSQLLDIPSLDDNAPSQLQEIGEVLHQHASHNASTWSKCIWLSGGQLNAQKCYIYASHPYINYKNNKLLYKGIPMPSHVTILNRASGHPVTIPKIPYSQAKRTLGVILSPEGAHKAQLKHTLHYAKALSGKFRNSRLSQKAKIMAFDSVIELAINYPLINTFFTNNEIKPIKSVISQLKCAALGLNQNFPQSFYMDLPHLVVLEFL